MYKTTLFFMLFVTFQQDTLALLDAANGNLLTELDCPVLKCHIEECIFGFAKDEDGCHICKCVEEGKEELFEGDIVLTGRIKNFLRKNIDHEHSSRTKRDPGKTVNLWKVYRSGNTYQVPYIISETLGTEGKRVIEDAIADFASSTCIRLIPRTNQKQYINFSNGNGCSSPVGRTSSQPQKVTLGNGCLYSGPVLHEILHALGFWHEQSRPDRNEHIKVHWENIAEKDVYNFDKLLPSQIDSFGSAYDIGSVMHYASNSFSTNGRPTITDLQGNPIKTQYKELSKTDIQQLNLYYECQSISTETGDETCEDTNGSCENWASTGECAKNPSWMLPNCCESCKKVSTTETEDENCEDKNESCEYWADIGECTKNPLWMKPNCCKSCTTGTGNENCEDKNGSCEYWASIGECTKNPLLMKPNCCKSCNCEDKNGRCEYWASIGECTANPIWMKSNCCESCTNLSA